MKKLRDWRIRKLSGYLPPLYRSVIAPPHKVTRSKNPRSARPSRSEEESRFAGQQLFSTRFARASAKQITPRPSVASVGATFGETLIEAIVAVSIFMYLVGPAAALFVTSIRNTGVNRNDLVAAVLANEGVEILRNIRDTNFLRFSPKAKECFNTVPEYTNLSTCHELANKINGTTASPQKYRLTLNPDSLNWRLNVEQTELNLSDGDDAVYQLRLDSQTKLYFLPPPDFIEPPPPAPSRSELSRFYREITVKYQTDSGDPAMLVESRVQYRNGNAVRTLERVLLLTNQAS